MKHIKPKFVEYKPPTTQITIGIATIPSREKQLREVVAALSPQCDDLHLYLDDDWPEVPAWLDEIENVTLFVHYGSKPLHDAGKFACVPESGYYLSCDDDIHYPPDYVDRTIEAIDQFGGIVSWHGSTFRTPFVSFYQSRRIYGFATGLLDDTKVDVGGTGVMGFRCEAFRPEPSWFLSPLMSDVWIAVEAKARGVRIVCPKHEAGWLKPMGGTGIYERFRHGGDERQTEVVRQAWPELIERA